jgi:hypothetical protein
MSSMERMLKLTGSSPNWKIGMSPSSRLELAEGFVDRDGNRSSEIEAADIR